MHSQYSFFQGQNTNQKLDWSSNGSKKRQINAMNGVSMGNNPLQQLMPPTDTFNDFNYIRFWSEVTDESCKTLIENIIEVEERLDYMARNYNIKFEDLPSIELYINSPGGSVHDALAVVDYIQSSKHKFTSIIEGCAASAATLISVVCDKRKIRQNAMVLIHELSSGCYGKMFEIDDSINSLKKVMDIIVKIYRENTKVQLNSLKEILKHDLYWTVDEAIQFGIVDEIIKSNKKIKYNDIKDEFVISKEELDEGLLKIKDAKENSKDSKSSKNSIIDLINNITSCDDEEDEEDVVEIIEKPKKVKAKTKIKEE